MQTFLPVPDFTETAQMLDYRRLGKQRVEAKQILQTLNPSYDKIGWKNHPAVRMWRGYEYQLCLYGISMCTEWINRGYKDSLLPWFQEEIKKYEDTEHPLWYGNTKFHRSHKSNLIRKFPEHYRPFWPGVPKTLAYVWPV